MLRSLVHQCRLGWMVALLAGLLLVSGCPWEQSSTKMAALGRITGALASGTERPVVGARAPNFQFQDADGQLKLLSDLRGKPVLINFWASWCWPCRQEMPFIQQIHEEWAEKGLVVLTVNLGESPSTVEHFLQRYGFSFPVLLDTKRVTSTRYNIRGIPTTFFIDRDGIIQERVIGAFATKQGLEARLKSIIP